MNGPPMWVVYDHPKDVPDYYVARLWRGDEPTAVAMWDADLESLRRTIANYGCTVRVPRAPGDDPVIVESWL